MKTQNAALEKKQHESWVTVRQETRKLTEAQNEMQTLRARLTVAETKLAEKTVEIESIMTENQAMKETMDRINNHQLVKPDSSKYFHEKNLCLTQCGNFRIFLPLRFYVKSIF